MTGSFPSLWGRFKISEQRSVYNLSLRTRMIFVDGVVALLEDDSSTLLTKFNLSLRVGSRSTT